MGCTTLTNQSRITHNNIHDCFRMNMVMNAGKSRRNVEAYVLLPPDARNAIDLLIESRSVVGMPPSNGFIFGRLTADTPMTGHTELQEIAQKCEGLKFPERITSRHLKTYIATVSQVRAISASSILWLRKLSELEMYWFRSVEIRCWFIAIASTGIRQEEAFATIFCHCCVAIK